MKYTRATFERSLFNLVFLNFLNIRKHFYKPQQFSLKRPTENDTVSFREHFYENVFLGTLSRTRTFSANFKISI